MSVYLATSAGCDMKLLLLLVLAWAAVAAAAAASLGASDEADKEIAARQNDFLKLFVRTQKPVLIPEHDELLKTFNWEAIKDKFKDPKLLQHFLYFYENREFLPRNKDFSTTYLRQFLQMILIADVLTSADNFDTFYKTAVWMRYHLNQRMFTYAVNAAVHLREDTKRIIVPPPYEVFPEYFITSDTIQRVYEGYFGGLDSKQDAPYIVTASYTGNPEAIGVETSLSYFREDVGLASYWVTFGLKYALWRKSSDDLAPVLKHRGLVFYYLVRNLLARYDMERYSHSLDPVLPVEVWEPVEGYDPKLRHQSGLEFPARPDGLKVKSTDELVLEDVMDWERRIRDGVAMSIYLNETVQVKKLTPENAVNTLGNIIMGSGDSPNLNYYGSIFYGLFTLFGRITDPRHKLSMAPSALQIPDTMTRDPVFYRILKRMWTVTDNYKKNLPPYTKEDVVVPGLKIQSVIIDKLLTFFDDFDIRVDSAVDARRVEDERKTRVVARQQQLDHKPFSYTLNLTSEEPLTAVVRAFLGPRVDRDDHRWRQDDVRHQFYLLDAFTTTLEAGANTLTRSSSELLAVSQDAPFLRELPERPEGFPQRLLLPRGWRSGLPASLLLVVTRGSDPAAPGLAFADGRDAFFPLDRRVFLWQLRPLPNVRFQQLSIFHRRVEDLNVAD